MPFNGSGSFVALPSPTFPAVADDVIYAARFNSVMNDVFAGLSQCLTRDGQSTAIANIPMSGFKFTGLGAGNAAGDSLMFGQTGAQLATLRVTTLLTGLGDFTGTGDSILVPTLPQGSNGNNAASVDFVNVAVAAAVAAAIPNASGNIEALAILTYMGA